MIINQNTVIFKSVPSMFRREQTGIKSNTVRILTYSEVKIFHSQNIVNIKIIDTSNSDRSFVRKITDISMFQPKELSTLFYIYIISWGLQK